ncbi:uncharacterized protein LOC103715418 isoform X1 [Phoenix dactylifera]|uniref:Uncharacterized protein LOC103715418 isoform X1 n=1 Tax=Phoenix dactylifera TaxID=42345 RepID=A0A8B7CKV7_PHODC|nr:uncharacterized protein LOC103715418 isoform X1 [Phoenix dactylifera]
MIENNNNPEGGKRYAPPAQRNRSLNRRKSGDRFEKTSYSYGIDGEKSQASNLRNFPSTDHGEAGGSNVQNENHPGLIPIDGCCTSEAAQLLNDRWANAMHLCNDPSVDLSERPTMYSGASGSSWGHLKLPHQMDFLSELRRAIHNAQINAVPTASERS